MRIGNGKGYKKRTETRKSYSSFLWFFSLLFFVLIKDLVEKKREPKNDERKGKMVKKKNYARDFGLILVYFSTQPLFLNNSRTFRFFTCLSLVKKYITSLNAP